MFSTNAGTYEADFAKIVNEIEARAIVYRLRGDLVTFPDFSATKNCDAQTRCSE